MSSAVELLLTSCDTYEPWSVCLWDYSSGNALQVYRNGGTVTSKTLNLIGNDFILTAEKNKPLLHVWPVNSQEQLKNVKLILPENTCALAVSPNCSYLALAISNKLYTWQLCSGKLLSVQQKHFQPITSIKFSSDSGFLVVAGQDGMLVMYNFGNLISLQHNELPQSEIGQVEPLYTRLDHSMPICDMHIGNFGFKSRFATVSSDHTCRIYNLLKGQLLLNLVFEEPLTSVIFDSPCWHLYVGGYSGVIRQFNLTNPPRTLEFHVDESDKEKLCFFGHQKKITCLDLNISNDILVSGSDDFKVFIWEIKSRQILRKIEHKAGVTNVKFTLKHENMFVQSFKPKFVVNTLQRSVELDDKNYTVSVIQDEDISFSDDEEESCDDSAREKIKNLELELKNARIINEQLYQTMVNFANTQS